MERSLLTLQVHVKDKPGESTHSTEHETEAEPQRTPQLLPSKWNQESEFVLKCGNGVLRYPQESEEEQRGKEWETTQPHPGGESLRAPLNRHLQTWE